MEATTAYNEAILHGELPPESNQATEDAKLLKGIIASVKAGKDPLTGQEIRSANNCPYRRILSILTEHKLIKRNNTKKR
ncbi:hypothetical protein HB954_01280 [Listeria welshimeri]|nr:hypothetical protein [Listeria welshimeri]MBC1689836.1 hypothetical protein [Listeria welshimeri]